MARQYTTLFERLGVPAWARGAMVGILAVILIGNLCLITFYGWSDAAPRGMALLGALWILGVIGCVFLARLWSAVTKQPRLSKSVKEE